MRLLVVEAALADICVVLQLILSSTDYGKGTVSSGSTQCVLSQRMWHFQVDLKVDNTKFSRTITVGGETSTLRVALATRDHTSDRNSTNRKDSEVFASEIDSVGKYEMC